MDQKEAQQNPPPSYSSVHNTPCEYGTKDGSVEQGYNYPQGYSTIPTQPQSTGQPTMQPYPTQPGYPAYPLQQAIPTAQQPTQANYVIVNQPQPVGMTVGMVAGEPKPPNYLCLSIFVCLCCNCLFGIIAIAFACRSDSAHAEGNPEAARKHGRRALIFSLLGVIISVIAGALCTFLNWNYVKAAI